MDSPTYGDLLEPLLQRLVDQGQAEAAQEMQALQQRLAELEQDLLRRAIDIISEWPETRRTALAERWTLRRLPPLDGEDPGAHAQRLLADLRAAVGAEKVAGWCVTLLHDEIAHLQERAIDFAHEAHGQGQESARAEVAQAQAERDVARRDLSAALRSLSLLARSLRHVADRADRLASGEQTAHDDLLVQTVPLPTGKGVAHGQ